MWWNALTLLQKIYFCIATPATVLLILQIVLMLIGFGGGEADFDGDVDVDVDVDLDGDVDVDTGFEADVGFNLFTVRGFIAFLTVGGWVGFTFSDNSPVLALILSLVCGFGALVGMAFLLKWLLSLQSHGNISYQQAVGMQADVYLTIPENGKGSGKVTLILNEALTELSAKTLSTEPIPTGSRVKVLGVENDVLVVEKVDL